MKYFYSKIEEINLNQDVFLTIGNFDGLHMGHIKIIDNLIKNAELSKCKSLVISFNPHPKVFFNKLNSFMINDIDRKVKILSNHKLDYLIDLVFDESLTSLTYNEFENLLFDRLSIKKLYIGSDFRYGSDRMGDIQTLQNFCKLNQIACEEIDLVMQDSEGKKISSSQIRNYLQIGDIEIANQLLNRQFAIKGKVIKGDQRGRTVGIPTANIEYPKGLIQIPYGVYAVKTKVNEKLLNGIVNFGMRPTFDKKIPIVEDFIFDFDQDIYGQEIEIFFFKKIRNEQKFNGIEELLNQIKSDITVSKKILNHGN